MQFFDSLRRGSSSRLSRRQFVAASSALALGSLSGAPSLFGAEPVAEELPPRRVITRGPKHHWFGYYDKLQFDPTDRYALTNQVDFEHRTPRADDTLRIGMVDLQDDNKWIELGTSGAWGWQQGCMLQWRPGAEGEVLWNDRDGDRYVCRLHHVKSGETRTISTPIYTVSPDGRSAMTADFRRIQVMRPGYGYVGLPDPHGDERAPKDSGVFHVDLESGESKLVLSLADMSKLPHLGQDVSNEWHWFNHLLICPAGKRFIVLNRWKPHDPETGGPSAVNRWSTRMITANLDGSDLYLLNLTGMVSHFVWRDPEHVCMWTKPEGQEAGFYVYRDRSPEIEIVGKGVMTRDGHNTYVPNTDNEWILNDTYPDKDRNQNPYLYHIPTNRRVELGGFHLPPEYQGEWRCDTHPRTNNAGRLVCLDAPHQGEGRQLHVIDIRDIIG